MNRMGLSMPAAKSLAYSLIIAVGASAGVEPDLPGTDWRRACESARYAASCMVLRKGSCAQPAAVERYSRRQWELDPKEHACALPPPGVI